MLKKKIELNKPSSNSFTGLASKEGFNGGKERIRITDTVQVAQKVPTLVLKLQKKTFSNQCFFYRRGLIKGAERKQKRRKKN